MAPEVEAVFGGLVVGVVSGRDGEDVGLDGVIDAGDVAARAGEVDPVRLAGAELGEAVVGVGEGGTGGFGVDQLVIDKRVADGVVVDLDVGEESQEGGFVLELLGELIDLVTKFVCAGLELGAIGGGEFFVFSRDGGNGLDRVLRAGEVCHG